MSPTCDLHSNNYHTSLASRQHTAPSGMAGLLQRITACIEDVSTWMSSNRLCLNPSKTKLIWLGSSRRLQNCATYGHRNERSGISHSSGRLGQRSRRAHQQRPNPCPIMSTKSPRCVTSIFDNFASCDEH